MLLFLNILFWPSNLVLLLCAALLAWHDVPRPDGKPDRKWSFCRFVLIAIFFVPIGTVVGFLATIILASI